MIKPKKILKEHWENQLPEAEAFPFSDENSFSKRENDSFLNDSWLLRCAGIAAIFALTALLGIAWEEENVMTHHIDVEIIQESIPRLEGILITK